MVTLQPNYTPLNGRWNSSTVPSMPVKNKKRNNNCKCGRLDKWSLCVSYKFVFACGSFYWVWYTIMCEALKPLGVVHAVVFVAAAVTVKVKLPLQSRNKNGHAKVFFSWLMHLSYNSLGKRFNKYVTEIPAPPLPHKSSFVSTWVSLYRSVQATHLLNLLGWKAGGDAVVTVFILSQQGGTHSSRGGRHCHFLAQDFMS